MDGSTHLKFAVGEEKALVALATNRNSGQFKI
jgi:hypothetical protein